MSNCKINKIEANPKPCGCGTITNDLQKKSKKLNIDLLYIDMDVCTRCKGTEQNLKEAIHDVENLLINVGYNVHVNNILIETIEAAEVHQLTSSPTIRINGRDIQLHNKETSCSSCSTITGENVDCRVWIFEDNEYTEAPKPLLIEAILKEIYGSVSPTEQPNEPYELPENLKQFLKAKQQAKQMECCHTKKDNHCCS